MENSGPNILKHIFSVLLFNIVPFEGDTMVVAVIPFFDTIFIERFRNSLKIDQIFDDCLLISARFFPASILLRSANRKRPLKARSGEYGEWGSSLIHAILPSF
jgi:hypothetical protein